MTDKEKKVRPVKEDKIDILTFNKLDVTEHSFMFRDTLFEKSVKTLYKNKKLSDITVINKFEENLFGVVKFHCHSVVVCQFSNFFRKEYDTKHKESPEKKVVVDITPMEITNSEFRKLMRYMYKGSFFVPKPGNESKWLKISHKLGMNSLRNEILGIMATYFKPYDAVALLERSLKNKQFNVYETCVNLIEVYDEKIFLKSKMFLDFSVDTLVHFVKYGRLSIDESDILRFVITYCLKHFKREGFQSGKDFFKKKFEEWIKYPHIEAKVIAEKIEKTGWVDDKYLMEAYRYNAVSEELREKIPKSHRTKERGYSSCGKFRGSTILNSKMQMQLFKFYMEDKPKKTQWTLQYKATKDGFNGTDFHKKCDKKGPTMVVIESTCGAIFGGYTKLDWDTQSRYSNDNSAFLFSLQKTPTSYDPWKAKCKPGGAHSVYHNMSYGPTFGGNHDMYISSNPQSTSCYSNVGHTYVPPSGKGPYLTSSNNFLVKDYEVFILK